MPLSQQVVFLTDRSFGAVSRLCLALAVTTLYLPRKGTTIVEAAHQQWVNVHTYRGVSHLKISGKWIISYVRKGWTLLTPVMLKNNRDSEPIMASRKQDSARRLRLEFQVFKIKTC